jgi:DNA-binding response OmpR family regulator
MSKILDGIEIDMIKKLRKFSNMTLLCVTNDAQLKEAVTSKIGDCKELIVLDNINDIIAIEKSFDIILVDYCFEHSLEIMKKLKVIKPLLPKIVILKEQNEDDIVDCINAGAYSLISCPVEFSDLKLAIIIALNQSRRVDKVSLSNGIYYDFYRERFYNADGAIPFTKFEFQVLKLLLDHSDRIIGYDEIKQKVWKDKKMSIFTMRNVINKIRKKTYYEIIKNNSSAGYQIDTLK